MKVKSSPKVSKNWKTSNRIEFLRGVFAELIHILIITIGIFSSPFGLKDKFEDRVLNSEVMKKLIIPDELRKDSLRTFKPGKFWIPGSIIKDDSKKMKEE